MIAPSIPPIVFVNEFLDAAASCSPMVLISLDVVVGTCTLLYIEN